MAGMGLGGKQGAAILAAGDLTQARRASEGRLPLLARRACGKPVRGQYKLIPPPKEK